MKTQFHPESSRGKANHGWLQAAHSFSFASWFNPSRMNFGALRVLNDDIVAAGAGFPTHPHDNMEIITIPLSGTLEHKDSMGNIAQLQTGEVQVMSAGTGITHSEYNASASEELKLFQIWIMPRKQGIEPRYKDIKLDSSLQQDQWQVLASADERDGSAFINQDATISMTRLESGSNLQYELSSPNHGVYFMVVDGEASIAGQTLQRRDAIGVEEVETVEVDAVSDSRILAIEVPMNF
jgi:redox-sensitive bicupin YhaK (pirin superfamily)